MEKQCAGCGTVFEDGKEPTGAVSPRPYGCCAECNKHTFRSKEQPAPAPEAEKPLDAA